LLYLLAFLFSFFLNTSSPAETKQLTFDVIHKQKSIGEISASKVIDGDILYYNSYSKTTTHSVIKITIISETEVQMADGHLQWAEANISVRGRPYAHSFTQYCNGQCEMIKDGVDINYIDQPIHYVSTLLLFEEPLTEQISFSEIDGTFHPIKYLGNHTYEKIDAKGRVNQYYYENGDLKRADIDAGLIKFTIQSKSK